MYIYPVKSLRGFSVPEAKVCRMGFQLDRRWMLVDEHGDFLTQRKHPAMATLSVENGDGFLTVRDPGGNTCIVPVDTGSAQFTPVTVWNSRLDALTFDASIDRFFSEILGLRCRMVRIPEAAVRAVSLTYGAPGDHVSFADAYPVLLTGTGSLADLNSRLASPVGMDRFRPNIVVSTEIPFEEDSWKLIRVGDVQLRVVKPCDRCAIVTTDQLTGVRSDEPLRTLATFRKRGNGVDFGMNLIPDTEGKISVGDPVDILA